MEVSFRQVKCQVWPNTALSGLQSKLITINPDNTVILLKMTKEIDVLLRREISIKTVCEKVKFLNSDFAMILVTLNEQTYKLFRIIFNDVQTEGKGKISTA